MNAQKPTMKFGIVLATSALSLSLAVGFSMFAEVPSFARPNHPSGHRSNTSESDRASRGKRQNAQNKQEKKQQTHDTPARKRNSDEPKKQKLNTAQLKSCRTNTRKITKAIYALDDNSHKQIDVFKTVTDRVIAFHDERQLNTPDFSLLVAEVNAKHDAAASAAATTKAKGEGFSCDESPRVFLDEYRTLTDEKATRMKEYKSAVRNLIVAVRSTVGAQKRSE